MLKTTILLLAGTCMAFGASVTAQDKGENAKKDAKKRELTPLYRFWDKKHNEHIYTYEGTEPVDWRQNEDFSKETIVGYAVNERDTDTGRLFRAYCKDGRHYFYLSKPPGAQDIERIEDFLLYVWTKPGDDRVPVHACFLPDNKDPFFDTDLKKVKDYAEETLKGINVRRRVVEKMFYVYPKKGAAKDDKEKK